MPFKKHLTPLTKQGHIDVHQGKGATQELLPSRHALNTLTGGDPAARRMNEYAKATPDIEEAGEAVPSPISAMIPGG